MRINALPSEAADIYAQVMIFAPSARLWNGGWYGTGPDVIQGDPPPGQIAVMGRCEVLFEGKPVQVTFTEWVGNLVDRRNMPETPGTDTCWYKTLWGWQKWPFKLEAFTPDGQTGQLRWVRS